MEKVRVVMCKLGLDIHWRGAVAVSRMLRDAGMEVIYIGNQFPDAIASAALQENADVVGMSTLGGNHLTLGPKTVEKLREKGMNDCVVLMGGVIPEDDHPKLMAQGIDGVFGPESKIEDIAAFIDQKLKEKRK